MVIADEFLMRIPWSLSSYEGEGHETWSLSFVVVWYIFCFDFQQCIFPFVELNTSTLILFSLILLPPKIRATIESALATRVYILSYTLLASCITLFIFYWFMWPVVSNP